MTRSEGSLNKIFQICRRACPKFCPRLKITFRLVSLKSKCKFLNNSTYLANSLLSLFWRNQVGIIQVCHLKVFLALVIICTSLSNIFAIPRLNVNINFPWKQCSCQKRWCLTLLTTLISYKLLGLISQERQMGRVRSNFNLNWEYEMCERWSEMIKAIVSAVFSSKVSHIPSSRAVQLSAWISSGYRIKTTPRSSFSSWGAMIKTWKYSTENPELFRKLILKHSQNIKCLSDSFYFERFCFWSKSYELSWKMLQVSQYRKIVEWGSDLGL